MRVKTSIGRKGEGEGEEIEGRRRTREIEDRKAAEKDRGRRKDRARSSTRVIASVRVILIGIPKANAGGARPLAIGELFSDLRRTAAEFFMRDNVWQWC